MTSHVQKTIAVVGATGNQGGSVAKTFLASPNWRVRCLTRKPSSEAAQALSTAGAEVIQADLSSESLLSEAFQGANAIFLNTDFWATYRARIAAATIESQTDASAPPPAVVAFDTEVLHGKNAAIAASKVPTLERFVYSSLPPMRKLSQGKYGQSYHWEAKAVIVEFIENELPELAKRMSVIYLGAYNTNPMLSPRLDPSTGAYVFALAISKDRELPIVDARASTGPFVKALIETEPAGTKFLAYDSNPTIGDIVGIWSRASGKEATFQQLTIEFMHERFGIPMELLEAMGFIEEYGYAGDMQLVEPDGLSTKVQTKPFEEWLREKDWTEVLEKGK
ncbi:hypothetical protein BP5796_05860 [Coleophoma crateriformis]|uniref:NmrA-like domain-containing protein n=1 Tax=Coleophoma crateriformis TaxID=565419 RepID=A0A3D8RVJ6_9HELO|nr:hypothetical protein BP5796_05860 [Coleophoma crateriformis]